MDYAERGREVINIEIEGLSKSAAGLGDSFARSIDLLKACLENGRKIIVTGIGKNLPVGQKIAATLTSTGSPAVFLHATDALHGELGILADGDVLIALSYSGESEELSALLPVVKRKKVPIIAITGSNDNTLARCADEVVLAAVDREACPFNMAPTATTTVTLAIGDAIAMVLLDARGFKKEDYAKLHPGGAIGRTLMTRVSDIMRTGKRVASVRKGQKVQDGVFAMTEARSGSVVVIDDARRVLGIFTDGDLRRHIGNPDLANETIDSLMTPNPITICEDQLAVDVLSEFEKHAVDDLIVVDHDGALAGMIDIQDLPKFKIM